MNDRKYKYTLYIITAVILSTIVIQGYWNYKNYVFNKQQLIKDIQISLDQAVDDYYSELAQKTTLGFKFEGDAQKDAFKKGGFFDDGGFPEGQGWDEIKFPTDSDEAVYALEVTGDSMMPLFRDGDRIIVSPNTQVRRGDRVVVKTVDGQVMAKTLSRQTAKTIELESLNPEHKNITFAQKEVEWMVRILWASQ